MKYQALFSSKDKSKKIKMSSAAILFGALRVKVDLQGDPYCMTHVACQVMQHVNYPKTYASWQIYYIESSQHNQSELLHGTCVYLHDENCYSSCYFSFF